MNLSHRAARASGLDDVFARHAVPFDNVARIAPSLELRTSKTVVDRVMIGRNQYGHRTAKVPPRSAETELRLPGRRAARLGNDGNEGVVEFDDRATFFQNLDEHQ